MNDKSRETLREHDWLEKQRISHDAALLAVQWNSDFAEALHHLTQKFAGDSATITSVHYQQALPAAVEILLANQRGSDQGLGPFSKEWRKVI